jgi:F-type H+-transporting ATPase subunit epsilon
MSAALHLTITTPAVVLVDSDEVASLRAEDASGSFGILPSHADLLTMLTPSVVRWRTVAGHTGFCAVKGGVLTVSQGRRVAIACREGIVDASLQNLEEKESTPSVLNRLKLTVEHVWRKPSCICARCASSCGICAQAGRERSPRRT